MKSPVHKTLGHILYELYSYAAAGVLGFYIGCMGAILILFGLGLQHPNRQVPVWVNIITWPIYIVPIIFCMAVRFFLVRRSHRIQQK